jgi:uncharacterized pyridoxamine 5'-phosphate oxidase family protein
VRETDDEIAALQAVIDKSFERMSSPQMRGIFKPERRLNARQLARYLDGVKHVTLATVTVKRQPRAVPLDGLFVHGRFYVSTSANSYSAKHLRRNAAVSLTHVVADEIGVIIHGSAALLRRGDQDVEEIHALACEIYGSDPFSWGDEIVFVRIDPELMFSYSQHPERFPP